MGLIARGFIIISVIQIVFCQISPYQQPATQYVFSNYQQSNGPLNTPKSTPLPPLPTPPPPLPTPVALPPKPSPSKPEITTGPESNVLNNLAIALQLLIVSNIMNTPEPVPKVPNLAKLEALLTKYESTVPYSLPLAVDPALSKPSLYSYEAQKPLLIESQSIAKPTLYSYETQSKPALYSYETQSKPALYSYETQSKPTLYSYETQSKPSLYSIETLPNANFMGSSGFSDPVFGSLNKVKPNPRAGVTLMSPYDALGTTFFDTFTSEFPTTYSKKDFQSPYASLLAVDGVRDMFSFTDYL